MCSSAPLRQTLFTIVLCPFTLSISHPYGTFADALLSVYFASGQPMLARNFDG